MTKISYHISHEQFKPSELLELVLMAERAGFKGALSSDHFHPWNNNQAQSGFAWSWLGAAMARTNLTFGIVNAPGQRYHPAIIAQASATLAEMFPQRFWLAVGSGQAVNERITGTGWPDKKTRNARLKESVQVIRELWKGEYVNHKGLITVEEAKLYTLPHNFPLIIGAAISAETAGWLAPWTDGLITISHPVEKLKEIVKAYRMGGGEGKPMFLKMQVSFDSSDEIALEGAFDQWKTNIFENLLVTELRKPEQFEAAAMYLNPEVMKQHVKVSSNPEKHIQWIKEYEDLGFTEIILHNVNRNQKQFIDVFGNKVLPLLKDSI